MKRAPLLLVASLLVGLSSTAHADEPWTLQLEPAVMLPVSSPQFDWFGPGLTGAVAVHRAVHPAVLLGGRLRGGFLFDGPAPADDGYADPGVASLAALTFSLRLRPLTRTEDPRRGTGLWLEAGGGASLTGSDVRAILDVGVGWGFEVGAVDIGPALRYLHVIQPNDQLEPRDASLLTLGLELTFLDARRAPPEEEEPEERELPPPDADRDGYVDPEDGCPQQPEDFDGFEDEDGCPDPDNDQDGLLDQDDQCPDDPEDPDGFADDDGCPDLDNDGDGILDADDACPDEPEVVNGVEDEDGCPDEGLIEMIDDRIVIEEYVLFDFERARVKSRARPTLDAIVELVRQHPEWALMRIEGHADARGNEDYNRSLSTRRARNVVRALVEAGMERESLEFVGYGSSRLRDQGTTEEAHQRNRRVEFVVVARHAEEDEADDTMLRGDEGGGEGEGGAEGSGAEGSGAESEADADMVFDSDPHAEGSE
ncbi:MAG TPA: OmpA family protein [Polyangiaceae bacterium LLY-WYZ-15_(1-7)]|nr:OmpA family protein [Polyangiaceae bacterium LLY-WYZ-15_(1-7)]HJL01240.1 OmpA family protein [Polyangiaceae bacterium LLY-WYZ-15_(1-7)]HJL10091.1 OmpA family protein [Polyangiaceae bacterium LLY-WYZ-15_(1-7)]HJL23791.1 OmpA family protein [Polyangiaceae bacterium LLY-WYZ-15_(1-7)]